MSERVKAAEIYGILAEFESISALVTAIHAAREVGYRKMDAYTPSPNEEVIEALSLPPSPMPIIVFTGGLVGGILGYFMQYYLLVVHYPLNVGGRPLHSWPYFIPITFECTVLLSALSAVIGLFVLLGLPTPYHPLFNVPGFERASQDRFFLCIESGDVRFDPDEIEKLFSNVEARRVAHVPN